MRVHVYERGENRAHPARERVIFCVLALARIMMMMMIRRVCLRAYKRLFFSCLMVKFVALGLRRFIKRWAGELAWQEIIRCDVGFVRFI